MIASFESLLDDVLGNEAVGSGDEKGLFGRGSHCCCCEWLCLGVGMSEWGLVTDSRCEMVDDDENENENEETFCY